jgi:hypothetical protein
VKSIKVLVRSLEGRRLPRTSRCKLLDNGKSSQKELMRRVWAGLMWLTVMSSGRLL